MYNSDALAPYQIPIASKFEKAMLPDLQDLIDQRGDRQSMKELFKTEDSVTLIFVIYILSNNVRGAIDDAMLYGWIRQVFKGKTLSHFANTRSFTARSALERLFRLAYDSQDTPMVKVLLATGIDPNPFYTARIPCGYERNLTYLEDACASGNFDLIEALLEGGADLRYIEDETTQSILVLAIGGAERAHRCPPVLRVVEVYNDGEEYPLECDCLTVESRLLDIIHRLILLNAAVNGTLYDVESAGYEHSPLTIASKCGYPSVVELLIKRGADMNYTTSAETTALQECLYSREAIEMDHSFTTELSASQKRMCCNRAYLCRAARASRTARLLISMRNINNCHVYVSNPKFVPLLSIYGCSTAIVRGNRELCKHALRYTPAMRSSKLGYVPIIEGSNVFKFLRSCHLVGMSIGTLNILYRGSDHPSTWRRMVQDHYLDEGDVRRALITAVWLDDWAMLDFISRLKQFSFTALTKWHETSYTMSFPEAAKKAIERDRCTVLKEIMTRCRILGLHPGKELIKAWGSLLKDANGVTSRWGEFLTELGIEWETEYEITEIISAIKSRKPINMHEILANNSKIVDMCDDFLKVGILAYHKQVVDDIITFTLRQGLADKPYPYNLLSQAILEEHSIWIDYLLLRDVSVHEGFHESDDCPLQVAIDLEDVQTIKKLIRNGAEVSSECVTDSSTLNILAARRQWLDFPSSSWNRLCTNSLWKILQISQENSKEAMDVHEMENLIEVSTNVNSIRNAGFGAYDVYWSLLEYAAFCDNDIAMEILLKRGAATDPRQLWKDDTTMCDENRVAGSLDNLMIFDWKTLRYTALQWAAIKRSEKCICMLLKADAKRDRRFCETMGPEACELLHRKAMEAYGDTNFDDVDKYYRQFWWTPLQIACSEGSMAIVEQLIQYGANVNAPSALRGGTALQFAARQGLWGMVVFLCDNGANVNAPGAKFDGRTALEAAAENGSVDVVQYLLNKGALTCDDAEREEKFERARSLAYDNGHWATGDLLTDWYNRN